MGISETGFVWLVMGFIAVFMFLNLNYGVGYALLNPFNGLTGVNIASALFLFFVLLVATLGITMV